MKPTISITLAREIAGRLCKARGVDLFEPDHWLWVPFAWIVSVCWSVIGVHVTSDEVRRSWSVTVPGAPSKALDLLELIPPVYGVRIGSILHGFCRALTRPAIFLSQSTFIDGGELLRTLAHELVHADKVQRDGALGSLTYLVPEARAAGHEEPAYTQSVAGGVWWCGVDVEVAVQEARASLGRYGLDAPAEVLANRQLDSTAASLRARAPIAGPALEIVSALRAAGITLPDAP
jgi:hypothetical protein